MGCLVTVFNYISYHLLEAPFQLSQSWIGLISIAYLAGIYSSSKAAQWSFKYGRGQSFTPHVIDDDGSIVDYPDSSVLGHSVGLIIFAFAFFAGAHSSASS